MDRNRCFKNERANTSSIHFTHTVTHKPRSWWISWHKPLEISPFFIFSYQTYDHTCVNNAHSRFYSLDRHLSPHTRWNVPHICWIYFICQSSKEPWKSIQGLFKVNLESDRMNLLSFTSEESSQCKLLPVGAPWRAAMQCLTLGSEGKHLFHREKSLQCSSLCFFWCENPVQLW